MLAHCLGHGPRRLLFPGFLEVGWSAGLVLAYRSELPSAVALADGVMVPQAKGFVALCISIILALTFCTGCDVPSTRKKIR